MLPASLPHYAELLPTPPVAGSGVGSVQYLRIDVLSDEFVPALRARVHSAYACAPPPPCLVVGMHLCGELSLRAIEAFGAIERVDALVLVPCCLPSRASPVAPASLFASPLAHIQHSAWCDLLSSRCRQVPHTAVDQWDDRNVASEKRTIIMVRRLRATAAAASPGMDGPAS